MHVRRVYISSPENSRWYIFNDMFIIMLIHEEELWLARTLGAQEAHRKGWRCWFAASSYGFLWHVVIIKVGFQSALALALRGSTEFIGGFKEDRIGRPWRVNWNFWFMAFFARQPCLQFFRWGCNFKTCLQFFSCACNFFSRLQNFLQPLWSYLDTP